MSFFYLRKTSCLLLLSTLFYFHSADVKAQAYNIDDFDGEIINTCSGIFYDSGGQTRGYRSNEDYAVTFCPEAGSVGKLIRLFFLEVDIRGTLTADEICFYDGNSLNSPQIGCIDEELDTGENYEVSASDDNTSGCLTVRFTSGFLPPFFNKNGWRANILCIDKCPVIESQLISSDPPVDADGFINVCPNQEVHFFGGAQFPADFDRADAAEFSWYFGDGQKADVVDAVYAYEESGGYKVQLSIVDPMTGCTNINDIDIRVRVSPQPQFELASELTQPICSGDTVSLSAAVNDGFSQASILVTPDTSAFLPSQVRSDSLALPDGEGTAYESSIFFDNFEANSTFQDSSDLLSICVNMEHSWARDLKISLRCPSGKEVILHNFWGQSGNRINLGVPITGDNSIPIPGTGYDYCWTPLATTGTWIEYNSTNNPGSSILNLPADEYNPYQSFNEFVGCPLNGQWTIEVEDLWAQDNGYIFNWQLNFDERLYATTDPFSPAITDFEWTEQDNLIYFSPDSIRAKPIDAGGNVFNFRITDEYGCVFDTLATIPVLPITHPDCYNCFDNEQPFELAADTLICNGDEVQLAEGVTALYDTIRFINMQEYNELGNDNHPPANPYESIIEINNIFPETIADASTEIAKICIDLEADPTEFISDYDIALQAPSGETMQLVLFQLFVDVGNSLTQTCFTSIATQSINNGTPPFTGDFSPMGDWSDLDGATKNGDWKLLVSDRVMGRQLTTLKGWSITFVSENTVNYAWSTAVGLSCTDCPNPLVTPEASTDYVLRTRDNFNCSYRDTIMVTNLGDFEAPMVDCVVEEENGLLRIDWTPQEGVEDYEISIDGGNFEVPNFNFFSHGVTGLDINQEISIEVRAALSNVPENLDCDIPTTQATCTFNACAFAINTLEPPSTVSCPGDSDGTIAVEVTDGVAPFLFELDGVEVQNSTLTTGNFSDLSVGMHTLIVTDADACSDTLNFMTEAPLPIDIQAIVSDVSCKDGSDGSIDLDITGGTGTYSYAWGDTSTDTTLNNLVVGSYEVVITDENNCTASANIPVTEPTALSISPLVTNAACFNTTDGSINAIVSGGTGDYDYIWSNGATTNFVENLIPDTYTLTVTDENNCVFTEAVEVLAPAAIVVDSITQVPVTCNGTSTGMATVYISGGTAPYQYRWSDELGQTSDMAQGLGAGSYSVTISDMNNCSTISNIVVTEPEILSIGFDVTDVNCAGGEDGIASALVIGGVEPYNYLWNDPETQNAQAAVELSAGTYTVTVTDGNNCEASNQVSVGEPDNILLASVEQSFTGCHGAMESEAIITPSGGIGEYSYAWSNGQSTATATNLDTIIYTVTVTDENNCEVISTIEIEDHEDFTININASIPSCNGVADGELGATVLFGGTGEGYQYQWNTEPPQSGFFIRDIPGGRTYTLTVTDSQGCEGIADYPMPQPNPIVLNLASTDVICNGETNGTVSVADITGGNPSGGYEIQWDVNTGNSTAQSIDSLGIGTYSVTATDMVGCTGTASITIGQAAMLSSSFEVTNNACNNGTDGAITAQVQGGVAGYDLLWSTESTENTITDLIAGVYTLTVTDANGCELVSTAEVFQPAFLDPQPSITDEIACAGENSGRIDLNPVGGTPPYTFSLDQQNFAAGTTFVGLDAGMYNIFMRDANGCEQNTSVTLNDPPEFTASISFGRDVDASSPTIDINEGDSLKMFANPTNPTGRVEWEWSSTDGKDSISCLTCGNPIAYPSSTVYYELYGIDENGCEATDLIQVRVIRAIRELLVPTGFSPNGDTENDVLLLHSKKEATILSFRIYDRWGELVHEMQNFPVNDPSFYWDGNFRGKEMPIGSYIWTAEVQYEDGDTIVFRGNTTLIR